MMCAFMTPVLKNDWEVYNSKRSRTNSETSSQRSIPSNSRSHGADLRRRVLSETRSMSYNMGHQRTDGEFAYSRPSPRAYHLSTRNSRNASRASFSPSHSGPVSPTKTDSKSNGPPRSPSSSSLSKFHNKVMDKLKNVLHRKKNSDSKSEDEANDDADEVKSNP